MTRNIWIPHPATIAARAMKYLQTLPRGKFVATGPLAQEMDQPSSAVITSLYKAVEHGLIVREKRNNFYHWALTDLGHEIDFDADPDEAPSPAKRPAPKPKPVKAAAKPDPAPEPEPEPEFEDEPLVVTSDTRWGGEEPDIADVADPVPLGAMKSVAAEPIAKDDPVAEAIKHHIDRDEPFRFNFCSDGTITVENGGQSVVMTPEDYQKLAKFIRVISTADMLDALL